MTEEQLKELEEDKQLHIMTNLIKTDMSEYIRQFKLLMEEEREEKAKRGEI